MTDRCPSHIEPKEWRDFLKTLWEHKTRIPVEPARAVMWVVKKRGRK